MQGHQVVWKITANTSGKWMLEHDRLSYWRGGGTMKAGMTANARVGVMNVK